jgi:hypothetical protein
MNLDKEKESIELKVSLKTWLQLIGALVIAGGLLFLLGSVVLSLLMRGWGLGVD